MNPNNRNLSTSDEGLSLIQQFESFVGTWYSCPAGKMTIGFGHVQQPVDHHIVPPISPDFAYALLRQDVVRFENAIKKAVTVPLSQAQFDALVSLVFNIGESNFACSTLLTKLNADNPRAAAVQFSVWIYATVHGKKKILGGLVTRRKAEQTLFLQGCNDE